MCALLSGLYIGADHERGVCVCVCGGGGAGCLAKENKNMSLVQNLGNLTF